MSKMLKATITLIDNRMAIVTVLALLCHSCLIFVRSALSACYHGPIWYFSACHELPIQKWEGRFTGGLVTIDRKSGSSSTEHLWCFARIWFYPNSGHMNKCYSKAYTHWWNICTGYVGYIYFKCEHPQVVKTELFSVYCTCVLWCVV